MNFSSLATLTFVTFHQNVNAIILIEFLSRAATKNYYFEMEILFNEILTTGCTESCHFNNFVPVMQISSK